MFVLGVDTEDAVVELSSLDLLPRSELSLPEGTEGGGKLWKIHLNPIDVCGFLGFFMDVDGF